MKSKFKNSGIYCIKNLKENKMYIGSSKNLKNRKNEHFRKLRRGEHHCTHLQKAFNKYEEKYFIFSIITYVESKRLIPEEDKYFKYYDIGNHSVSYNLLTRPERTTGFKHSLKSRELMSRKHKGRTFTEEHRRNLSLSERGQKRTEAQRKRMSEGCRKRGFTEKQRKVLEERNRAHKGHGNPNSKWIIAVELRKAFYCITEVAKGFHKKRSVFESSLTKGTTACGFHWMHLEKYKAMSENQIVEYLKEHESPYKAIYCKELNMIFLSVKEAVEFTKCKLSRFRKFKKERIVKSDNYTFYYLPDVFQKVPLNYKVYNKREETEKLIEDGVIIIPKKENL